MKYVRRIVYSLLLAAAVNALTESACLARNHVTPDAPGVVYESVMSCCKKAQHGKFPLNMTYFHREAL